MEFNLRHLKAVVATAAAGRVSAAASAVNLTQPAITQAIAKVERQIGLSLFERRPNGMKPTAAADILIARAEAALALIGSSRVSAPQVRAFLALAQAGSYAGAALVTGNREASLHRAVADLSLGLGQKLVDRRGRGVVLTRQGLSAARRFRLARAELQAALVELEALKGREVGRITIGAMPLSRARLLPDVLTAFHHAYPQVDIKVVEGSHAELLGPLQDGTIDLMIGALRDGPIGGDLVQQALFKDRPVVLGRARHPLAMLKTPVTPVQLAQFEWVMPGDGAPLRQQWRELFLESGVEPPRVAIECGSVAVVRELLVKGDLLTLLSPDQVAVELEAGWLSRINAEPSGPQRLIGLTARAAWRPTPLQQNFLETIQAESQRIRGDED